MKKTLSLLIIVLLFFITFSISFNGITSGKDDSCIGRIYGQTYQIIGWETFPTPFVLLQTGFGFDISDIFGYYEINNLPLNQVYELRANKLAYEETTVYVELTTEQPEVEVNIMMILKETSFSEHDQKFGNYYSVYYPDNISNN